MTFCGFMFVFITSLFGSIPELHFTGVTVHDVLAVLYLVACIAVAVTYVFNLIYFMELLAPEQIVRLDPDKIAAANLDTLSIRDAEVKLVALYRTIINEDLGKLHFRCDRFVAGLRYVIITLVLSFVSYRAADPAADPVSDHRIAHLRSNCKSCESQPHAKYKQQHSLDDHRDYLIVYKLSVPARKIRLGTHLRTLFTCNTLTISEAVFLQLDVHRALVLTGLASLDAVVRIPLQRRKGQLRKERKDSPIGHRNWQKKRSLHAIPAMIATSRIPPITYPLSENCNAVKKEKTDQGFQLNRFNFA